MKQLDKLLLKIFFGPFLITFVVSVFMLIMQFLWLYIDDLLGKGVSFFLVLELIFYWSSMILPLAVPLSILLSSIMTFGNLGEHFELTAVKSAGISIQRFARPLLTFILILSVSLYLFQNFVAPKFNLNALALLHDIRQKKPAFDLRPNVFFNQLEGYSILISGKSDDDDLYNIQIYDHTDHRGINKYIYAEKGKMKFDPDTKSLIFELYNGYRSDETGDYFNKDYEHRIAKFETWALSFDESQFDLKRIGKEAFENNTLLMNGAQLEAYIRKCDTNLYNATKTTLREIDRSLSVSSFMPSNYQPVGSENSEADDILPRKYRVQPRAEIASQLTPDTARETYPLSGDQKWSPYLREKNKSDLINAIRTAKSRAASLETNVKIQESNEFIFKKQKVDGLMQWHRKFSISAACILLFIIGASLGAIIRKGGLGLPIIVAVMFFIFYYLLVAFGEKYAKQEKVSPAVGVWMATFILSPIAFTLFRKAVNDSPLLDRDLYINIWRRMKSRLIKNGIAQG